MAKNDVFANGREIACKAASGKSVAAFPDVCFTPPDKVPATPPGIPIPYPNTAKAKDLAKGSKTVKISKKPVMLKNKSYFKTSMGNEPAKPTVKKGLITKKVKGKAYFTSWSMNVKIEGKNVCRHLDLTTHNHGSSPGNTVPWPYTDSMFSKPVCSKEKKAVEKNCETSEQEKKAFKKKQQRKTGASSNSETRPMTWKDKSCGGLLHKPTKEGLAEAKKMLKEGIEGQLNELNNILKNRLGGVSSGNGSIQGSGNAAALLAGPYTAIMETVAAAATVSGALPSLVSGGIEAHQTYSQLSNKMGQLRKEADKLGSDLNELKKRSDLKKKEKGPGLSSNERSQLRALDRKYKKEANDMADNMADKAKNDACLRARKCGLVPYNDTARGDLEQNLSDSRGCCPGQTGHHLLPKSYFKDGNGNDDRCPSYDPSKAPTVCLEGTSHTQGSHRKIHLKQDDFAGDFAKAAAGKLSYDDARDASLDAFEKTLPEAECSRECLKAQLDEYHKDCKDKDLRPVSAMKNAKLVDLASTPRATTPTPRARGGR